MPTAAEIKLDKKAISPLALAVYPLIGKAYKRTEGDFSYSDRLVITDKNYNYADSQEILEKMIAREELPGKSVFSTAAMEHALDLAALREGKDPREARHNDDFFARNTKNSYKWAWTSTLLKTPKDREPGKYETDKKGNRKYPRDVFEGDEQISEMLVPVGDGLVVVEFDPVTGVPSETRSIDYPHKNYYDHFWFDPNKPEVAVGRRGDWLHDGYDRCLSVLANRVRSGADSGDGFRPVVRGSGFEIEPVSSNVDVEAVRREILERTRAEFASDVANLSVQALAKKYL